MAMKLNNKLMQDLQKKSINMDMEKYKEYQSKQSKQQKQDLGNFRVRPISSNPNKKEIDTMSTATSFFKNNPSIVAGNGNDDIEVKRPSTPVMRKSTINFHNQKEGTPRNQKQNNNQSVEEDEEAELERYIIESNHNNINNFNADLPLLDSIEPETLEEYLDVPQELFFDLNNLAIKFDANGDSLQILGDIMPALRELKLNNSIIGSIRDIGTSLVNLKILWINRVGLEDLSGINCFPNLKELYANYNSVTDLMPLDFNDSLEILDLEGNDISDENNIQFLETMGSLVDLNLSNNEIAKSKNYRKNIKQKMGNLQILDEKPLLMDGGLSKQEIEHEKEMEEMRLIEQEEKDQVYEIYSKLGVNKNSDIMSQNIKNSIEQSMNSDPREEEVLLRSVKKMSKKVSLKKDLFMVQNSNQNGENQQENNGQSASSGLTEGTDQAFSGNPLKALKHNKRSNQNSQKVENNMPQDLNKMIENFKRTDQNAMQELREELNMEHYNENNACPPTVRRTNKIISKCNEKQQQYESEQNSNELEENSNNNNLNSSSKSNIFNKQNKQQQQQNSNSILFEKLEKKKKILQQQNVDNSSNLYIKQYDLIDDVSEINVGGNASQVNLNPIQQKVPFTKPKIIQQQQFNPDKLASLKQKFEERQQKMGFKPLNNNGNGMHKPIFSATTNGEFRLKKAGSFVDDKQLQQQNQGLQSNSSVRMGISSHKTLINNNNTNSIVGGQQQQQIPNFKRKLLMSGRGNSSGMVDPMQKQPILSQNLSQQQQQQQDPKLVTQQMQQQQQMPIKKIMKIKRPIVRPQQMSQSSQQQQNNE